VKARRRRGRGGRGGAEPVGRVRQRELETVERHLQGMSQRQIAMELDISQAAVSKILARVERRALGDHAELVMRMKGQQTLQLDHIRQQAMAAWHASKTEATRRRQRRVEGGTDESQTIAEVTVESTYGDARYLSEARAALADLRKLWGLDAPQKVDVRATPNPYMDLTDEALREEVARQQHLLEACAVSALAEATKSEEPNDGGQ
jgi:DNA-binding CsgD family transcriptional regulator